MYTKIHKQNKNICIYEEERIEITKGIGRRKKMRKRKKKKRGEGERKRGWWKKGEKTKGGGMGLRG